MKSISFKSFLSGVVAVASLAFGAQAIAQERPEIKVGDTRTYVKKDRYGKQVDERTYVVVAKTADGYTINRTISGDAVTFGITGNLGQNSPVDGKQGDGNLYNFPLYKGMNPWTSISYWKSRRGLLGYDEVEYTVKEETEITVPAGTFKVTKVTGVGQWHMDQWSGRLEVVGYYSPVVKNHVRYERTEYSNQGVEADVLELLSYKNAE